MALSHYLCLSQVSPFGITNQRPHPISIAPFSAEKTSKRISVIRSTINSESKTSLENDRTNIKNNMARRSGNYSPTIWHFDYVQSLTSHYGVCTVSFVLCPSFSVKQGKKNIALFQLAIYRDVIIVCIYMLVTTGIEIYQTCQ